MKPSHTIKLVLLILLVITGPGISEELEPDHPEYPRFKKQLEAVNALYRSGAYNRAAAELKKLLPLGREIYGEESTGIAEIYNYYGTLVRSSGDLDSALTWYENAREIQKKALGEKSIHTANSTSNIGLVYFQKGKNRKAIENYSTAVSVYIEKLGPDHPSVGISYINLGKAHGSLGDVGRARDYYNRSREIFEKAGEQYRSYLAVSHNNLGDLFFSLGKYPEAEEHLNKSLEIRIETSGKDHPDVATTYMSLGRIHYIRGEYRKAVELYDKAEGIYIAKLGPTHMSTAYCYSLYGETLVAMGKYEKAIEYYRKMNSIYTSLFGPDHLYAGTGYMNMGEAYRSMGDYNRAIEYHERARSIYEKKLPENHTHFGSLYNYIGGAYKDNGDYKKSALFFKKALGIYGKNFDPDHPYIATTSINIGIVAERIGNYDEAIAHNRKALDIYLKKFDRDHPYIGTTYNNLGLCYFRKELYKNSLKYYNSALEIYLKKLGKTHPYVAYVYANMSMIYEKTGDIDRAIEYQKKSREILKRGTDHGNYIMSTHNLARLYLEKENRKKAGELLEEAVNTVLQYRLILGRGKVGIMDRYIGIFDLLITINILEDDYEKAFLVDGMKRGLSITEGISLKNALSRGGVPEKQGSRLQELHNTIGELSSLHKAAIAKNNPEEADAILNKIWKNESEMNRLDKQIQKDYPAYRLLRSPRVPRVNEIRSELSEDEIAISYTFIDNQMVIFSITRERGISAMVYREEETADISRYARALHFLLKKPVNEIKMKKVQVDDGDAWLWDFKNDTVNFRARKETLYRLKRVYDSQMTAGRDPYAPEYVEEKAGTLKGLASTAEKIRYRKTYAEKLHTKLIGPVVEKNPGMKKLVIIPDKYLYYIPFGLLRNSTGTILYDTFRYTLAHSAIVWYNLRKKRDMKFSHPILAMGNAVYNTGHASDTSGTRKGTTRSSGTRGSVDLTELKSSDRSILSLRTYSLKNLPGTGYEIRAITRIAYSGSERDRHVYDGVRASEDMIFALRESGKLRDYRILHFAVHGLFMDQFPWMNSLILSQPGIVKNSRPDDYDRYKMEHGDLQRDGFLQMAELKTLDITSDLVVMSACETSMGEDTAGEGIVGLPQAFLIAGARSVIASLWSVDDEATAFLMEEFYRNLLEKKLPPEEALRKAQLVIREEFADPFYWAAFILYGR